MKLKTIGRSAYVTGLVLIVGAIIALNNPGILHADGPNDGPNYLTGGKIGRTGVKVSAPSIKVTSDTGEVKVSAPTVEVTAQSRMTLDAGGGKLIIKSSIVRIN